jgi:DNA-binding IclR family transcriptional regulator
MRGLGLLEIIDAVGPITVSELARRTGIERSIVSRMVSACERDGWVVRNGRDVALGPRAALLAHSSAAAATVRQAEVLVDALSGVTGLPAQAYGLIGAHAAVLASAGDRGPSPIAGLSANVPLFATAAGLTIAAQLDPDELDRLLPPAPFPDPIADMAERRGWDAVAHKIDAQGIKPAQSPARFPRDRRELARQLDQIRSDGIAIDDGALHPEIGCIAIPWPRAELPAALACMGAPATLEHQRPLTTAVLAAAAAPGARREDIIAAAAATLTPATTQSAY